MTGTLGRLNNVLLVIQNVQAQCEMKIKGLLLPLLLPYLRNANLSASFQEILHVPPALGHG